MGISVNEEEIIVQHGVYVKHLSNHFIRKDYYFCQKCGRVDYNHLPLPQKFFNLLLNKCNKFFTVDDIYKTIDFTYAKYITEKSIYYAIAITHPKDNFSKKIGSTIVKGRIKRLLGKSYYPIPNYCLVEMNYKRNENLKIQLSESLTLS